MSFLNRSLAESRPAWFAKAVRMSACSALVLLICSGCAEQLDIPTAWRTVLAGLAALLAGIAYALDAVPEPGRLTMFGKDSVQVRSLDEWTQYKYSIPYEVASPEQQEEALSHYRVGLRLFPARPQDRAHKRGVWQWLLSVVVFSSFVLLSEATRGWYRVLLFLAYCAWFWLCVSLSKRFSEVPTTDALTRLNLS